MKKYFLLLAAFVAAFSFTSCLDDDDDKTQAPVYKLPYYAYILGEGNWDKNDAVLTGFTVDGVMKKEIYYNANQQRLGDLANDLVYSPNRVLYVAVSGSEYVAKLDLNGKELTRVSTKDNAELTQPRSMVLAYGKLYVSTYGGNVAVLDTADLHLITKLPCGAYAEEIAATEKYIAVCNSGYGQGNTLSIYDAKMGTALKTIELPRLNPQNIVAQGDKFYVNTTEYDENWQASSKIIQVDPETGKCKVVADAFYMTPLVTGGLMFISQKTEDYVNYANTAYIYSPTQDKLVEYKLGDKLSAAYIYAIETAPLTGYVFCLTNNMSEGAATGSSLHILGNDGPESTFNDTGCPFASSIAFAY